MQIYYRILQNTKYILKNIKIFFLQIFLNRFTLNKNEKLYASSRQMMTNADFQIRDYSTSFICLGLLHFYFHEQLHFWESDRFFAIN